MALSSVFVFQNVDSTLDMNSRYKDLILKGFVTGGEVTPVSSVLQVDVAAFRAVSFDGMVVTDSVSTRLTVIAGNTNYVVLLAKYNPTGAPTLEWQVLEESAYLASPDIDFLIVRAIITLGGGATEVLTSDISLIQSDVTDQLTRFVVRGHLSSTSSLPATQNRVGDAYVITDGTGDNPNIWVFNGLIFVNVTQAGAVGADLTLHRQNLFSNEIHLTDDQADALIGTSGSTPTILNPFVDNADTRIPTQDENDGLVGVPNSSLDSAITPPGDLNRYVTQSLRWASPEEALNTEPGSPVSLFASTIIEIQATGGPFWVGNAGTTTAYQYFNVFDPDNRIDKEYVNSEGLPIKATGVFIPPTAISTANRKRTSNVASIQTSVAHGLSTSDLVLIVDMTDTSYNTLSATITVDSLSTASRERTSNIATLETSTAHGFEPGYAVAISSMGDATYDTASAVILSTPSTTTFTYANTGTDEGNTADVAGTVDALDFFTYSNTGTDEALTADVGGTVSKDPAPLDPSTNSLVAGKGFYPNKLWIFVDNAIDTAFRLGYGRQRNLADIPPDALIARGPTSGQLDNRAAAPFRRQELFGPLSSPTTSFVVSDFFILANDSVIDVLVKENGIPLLPDDGSFEPIVIQAGINDTIDFEDSGSTVYEGSGTNEVQLIKFSAVPDSGSFTLSHAGNPTASMPFGSTASFIASSLNALASLSTVEVTGDFLSGFAVHYNGADGALNQPLLVEVANTLLIVATPIVISLSELIAGASGGAKLTPATYSTIGSLVSFLANIGTAMSSATGGLDTYTATFTGKSTPFNTATDFKFTIAIGAGTFKLLFGSGSGQSTSVANTIGFNLADKTGFGSYLGASEIDRGYVGYAKTNTTTIITKRSVPVSGLLTVEKITIGDN